MNKEIVTIENAFIEFEGEQCITWKALAEGLSITEKSIVKNINRHTDFYLAACRNSLNRLDSSKSARIFTLEMFEVYVQVSRTTEATVPFRMKILNDLWQSRRDKTLNQLEHSKVLSSVTFERDTAIVQLEKDRPVMTTALLIRLGQESTIDDLARYASMSISTKITGALVREILLKYDYVAKSHEGYYPTPSSVTEGLMTYNKSNNSSKYLLRITPKGIEALTPMLVEA